MFTALRRLTPNGYFFRLDVDEEMPPEAVAVAFAYWYFVYDPEGMFSVCFSFEEVKAIPSAHGVRGALKIATAVGTATIEDATCPDCGGPLVLKNRGALEKFIHGSKTKCRNCMGHSELMAARDGNTLLENHLAEQEARKASSEDLFEHVGFTRPVPIDGPEVQQLQQTLLDNARWDRMAAYGDIPALIERVDRGLLAPAMAALETAVRAGALEDILRSEDYDPRLGVTLAQNYSRVFHAIHDAGLCYHLPKPKAQDLVWHEYSPIRLDVYNPDNYAFALAGPCKSNVLNAALLLMHLGLLFDPFSPKRIDPRRYRDAIRDSIVAEATVYLVDFATAQHLTTITPSQLHQIENAVRSATRKLTAEEIAYAVEGVTNYTGGDNTSPDIAQWPHQLARAAGGFYPGPQTVPQLIEGLKQQLRDVSSIPELPAHHAADALVNVLPLTSGLLMPVLRLDGYLANLDAIVRRLKILDQHNAPATQDERDLLELYFFAGGADPWSDFVMLSEFLLTADDEVTQMLTETMGARRYEALSARRRLALREVIESGLAQQLHPQMGPPMGGAFPGIAPMPKAGNAFGPLDGPFSVPFTPQPGMGAPGMGAPGMGVPGMGMPGDDLPLPDNIEEVEAFLKALYDVRDLNFEDFDDNDD